MTESLNSPKQTVSIKPGQSIRVRFESMALGGKAKGTPVIMDQGSCAVFTAYAAPGDLAEVNITKIVKRYIEAGLQNLIEPAPDRVEPICKYFGQCGGCHWQHLSYERQCIEKEDVVRYVLARNQLGNDLKIELIPSAHPIHYRSRADLRFTNQRGKLIGGFLKSGSHELLEIDSCPLLVEHLSAALLALPDALSELVPDIPEDWPFRVRVSYDPKTGSIFVQPRLTGNLSQGLIGTYRLENGFLVEDKTALMEFVVDGLRIKYTPLCFTQVNLETNEDLVSGTLSFLEVCDDDEILELYAGIGNFTLPVAKRVKNVVAVESAPESSRFSKINAEENSITNIRHIRADALEACRAMIKKGRMFSKILVDPPRTGMGEETVNAICDLEPERIVSVSCHPDTLAKDIKRFLFRGYQIESIRAYDMFGQTFHVETITVLVKE